jgi:hypothetical protein
MNQATRWRLLACVGTSALALGLTAQACGGGTNAADAGPDATSSDSPSDSPSDAQADVTTDDGGCPSYNGSTAYCLAAEAHCTSCGGNFSACQRSHFTSNCEAFGLLFSQAYSNAFTTCETSCTGTCFTQAIADASLTAAQTKVATDYCAMCSDAGGCVAFIEQKLNLIDYSDNICNQIDSTCTPDSGAACASNPYDLCAATVISSGVPNPCADAAAD